jgi:hypothetical protein
MRCLIICAGKRFCAQVSPALNGSFADVRNQRRELVMSLKAVNFLRCREQ